MKEEQESCFLIAVCGGGQIIREINLCVNVYRDVDLYVSTRFTNVYVYLYIYGMGVNYNKRESSFLLESSQWSLL